ncbi:fumarylacetoacetate hydrolase family protein [Mucilaginibacter sp. RS28]|uniref:Fumarylacetoacetate hydrolase family protein n=1 Tax=Mucilaginibacter straminoryzae TaxID=2932774 RepID=A0A9X2BCD3_9SPHI|nr:fumarylacetoacetate hydrolase family protein [Mucilaginibacter straminoryzae]MCJ8209193.1 fumarylacetoacetate hydrolase family protein [Mucilaginibacter straminoryzae]
MHIFKSNGKVIVQYLEKLYTSAEWCWDSFINRQGLHQQVLQDIMNLPAGIAQPASLENIDAPIAGQEIWASGVTYLRSMDARMEEAKDAGGGDFYSRVYNAKRPELFFKSAGYRAIGPGGTVRIRKDSKWNVPEPELVLFICSAGTIEGYMIGNDMSSRDIEGENPLYLPQAKSYDGAASIGPCLFVPAKPIDPDTKIQIEILRGSEQVFADEVLISRMKRTHAELAEYLLMELSFPQGVYLMTGTGIVPPDSFTLQYGDVVNISIGSIGRLSNVVGE